MNKKPYSDDRWIGTLAELDPNVKPLYRSPEQKKKDEEFLKKMRKMPLYSQKHGKKSNK